MRTARSMPSDALTLLGGSDLQLMDLVGAQQFRVGRVERRLLRGEFTSPFAPFGRLGGGG